MSDHLPQKVGALLYAHGGEMKRGELIALLEISEAELARALEELRALLNESGLELVESAHAVSLRTRPAYGDFIAEALGRAHTGDIGNAGLEILSIVLYTGGASRSYIDYIRGVNSSNSLRQLVMRGLIERERATEDARQWHYTVTPELLATLGVADRTQLPEYEAINSVLCSIGEKVAPADTDHEEEQIDS